MWLNVKLHELDGRSKWSQQVGPSGVTVGRGATCDLRVPDPLASKLHARIVLSPDGGALLTDLNAASGTLVDGQRVEGSVRLRGGEAIQVGRTMIVTSDEPIWSVVGGVAVPNPVVAPTSPDLLQALSSGPTPPPPPTKATARQPHGTPSVFISYRREDSMDAAGRLFDWLVQRLGRSRVFMDVDSLRPGTPWIEAIEAAVGSCDVLVALLGRTWTESARDGVRRLDDPQDRLRVEIRTALRRGVLVIPVLVQGARMPTEADLPEDIRDLVHRQGVELRGDRWADDTAMLIGAIEAAHTR